MANTEIILDQDELVIKRTEYGVGDLVDDCKARHNEGLGESADGSKHICSVSGVIIEHWCREKGISFKEFFRDETVQARFFNDPDYSYFRIWKGKV